MWMTVEYTFVKNNVFWKLVFERVAEFCVEMKIDGKDMWNVVFVFACACSTTNSKPFSTWFYFNNFVDVVNVSASCMEATGNDVFAE